MGEATRGHWTSILKSSVGGEGRKWRDAQELASHFGTPHVTVFLIRFVLLTILAETNVKIGLCMPSVRASELVERHLGVRWVSEGIPCGIKEFSLDSPPNPV